MAGVISHQDPSRASIGATAHAVAYARAVETNKGSLALAVDPYAQFLALNIGKDCMESLLSQIDPEKPSQEIVDKEMGKRAVTMAIRTRKIDDVILSNIANKNIKQVILLGAGLDTRAWRLGQFYPNDIENDSGVAPRSSVETEILKEKLKQVNWFELDFAEMFQFKLNTLESNGAIPSVNYHSVVADLSLPGWIDKLVASGYDPLLPSLWLLEGFINYLTEDEAISLFNTLKLDTVTSKESCILMTSVSQSRAAQWHMHTFRPDDPYTFFASLGFHGTQEEFAKIAKEYNRTTSDFSSNYYLLQLYKNI